MSWLHFLATKLHLIAAKLHLLITVVVHVGVFPIINAGFSFGLVGIIVYILIRYASVYNAVERLGHGIAGAAVFFSAFKQLGLVHLVAPFEPTYQSLWRLGWILLLGGKVYRLHKHQVANDQQKDMAKAYFAARAVD